MYRYEEVHAHGKHHNEQMGAHPGTISSTIACATCVAACRPVARYASTISADFLSFNAELSPGGRSRRFPRKWT